MKIKCFWEHNGDNTLLYAIDYPGAHTRGENLGIAKQKMPAEIRSFALWSGQPCSAKAIDLEIAEEKMSDLAVCDADSDAIFSAEMLSMNEQEYQRLKALCLRSAADFLRLYRAIPDCERSCLPPRETFYGNRPRTAKEMYEHTKNVNSYYFGEIGVDCDNDNTIVRCREYGFAKLETQPNFLANATFTGSCGEQWSLKKVLRRFIWHDRIHAKAMYRMALKTFATEVLDPFHFMDI